MILNREKRKHSDRKKMVQKKRKENPTKNIYTYILIMNLFLRILMRSSILHPMDKMDIQWILKLNDSNNYYFKLLWVYFRK